MNSNNTNAATSLMGYSQMYDDTKLRKKVNCLVSGLLLCFVIGVAALGIAIMVLLKADTAEEMSTGYLAQQTDEVAKLKQQINSLQSDLTALQNEMIIKPPLLKSQNVHEMQPEEIDISLEFPEDNSKKETEDAVAPPASEEPATMGHNDHDAHDGHGYHGGHGGHGDHGGHELHSSHGTHTDHQNHAQNGDQSGNEDLGDLAVHEDHGDHLIHEDHAIHTGHEGHTMFDEDVAESPWDQPPYDDSDNLDGSGSGDIARLEDDIFGYEGSGTSSSEDKTPCFKYSRPTCPIGVQICNTTDPCPVPICCPN